MTLSMKASVAALIAGACLFGASGAIAQAAKPDPRLATFKANDKNKDGKLAKEEFNVIGRSYGFGPTADAIFAQSDKNKDAFLQEAEYLVAVEAGNKSTTQVVTAAPSMPAAPPAGAKAAFTASDKNKNGKLDKTEFAEFAKAAGIGARTDAAFTLMDTDKDLSISEAEFAKTQTGGLTIASAPRPQGAVTGPGGAQMSFEAMKAQMLASFKASDKNKDGKLSKPEFAELTKAMGGSADEVESGLKQFDKNSDAFVTQAEFEAAFAGAAAQGDSMSVGAPTPTPDQRVAAFKASDKNKDGKLTKAEYTEVLKILGFSDQLEAYWATRDVNKDGFITEAEYAPAIAGGTAIPIGAPKQ